MTHFTVFGIVNAIELFFMVLKTSSVVVFHCTNPI